MDPTFISSLKVDFCLPFLLETFSERPDGSLALEIKRPDNPDVSDVYVLTKEEATQIKKIVRQNSKTY